MGINGRRAGGATTAFLSLCLGLSGCMLTETGYQPMTQPSNGCANCSGPNGAIAGVNAPAGSEIQQTAYRPTGGMPPQGQAAPVEGAVDGMANGAVEGAPSGPACCPRELGMTSHPPYTVAPPDVLLINAIRLVPKGPYVLEPLEVLQIAVTDTLPGQPIAGTYMVSPEGTISLGHTYGNLRVAGLSLTQTEAAIRKHLSSIVKNATVSLGLVQFRGVQQIAGQHLVRPDGTISLGTYGSVYIAGLNLGQVKCVVEKYLSEYLVNPQITVDMLSYNSKKYYVIFDGGGYGQQVFPLPVTGNETVLDAISRVGGLAPVSSTRKIVLARPSPVQMGCNQILPVDWKAVEMGSTATNYQIFPGDRIYVFANPLIAFDNRMAQVLAPVERLLGITLLGTFTFRNFQNNNSSTGSNGGFILAPR
jgi:polysaccharide biosynthesis/export protein